MHFSEEYIDKEGTLMVARLFEEDICKEFKEFKEFSD
jgi:hypothetical protein